jgi:hypothetical protein
VDSFDRISGLHAHPGAPLADRNTTGMAVLLTDIQVAVDYLGENYKTDTNAHEPAAIAIRRHAWRTYQEAVDLLSCATISDEKRRYLEAQMAILHLRLVQTGEDS